MRRAAPGIAALLMLASAFALYAINVATRRIELDVQASERRLERLESEIAVLKADRAYLARPTRIESAARALGMRPAAERQQVRIEDLALRRAPSADASIRGGGP